MKVDAWILNRIYQPLVNRLGINRTVLIDHLAICYLVFRLLNLFITGSTEGPLRWMGVFFAFLLTGWVMYANRLSDRDVYFQGQSVLLRLLFVALLLVEILLAVIIVTLFFMIQEQDAKELLNQVVLIVGSASIVSILYVMICKDPPPPKKRHSLERALT